MPRFAHFSNALYCVISGAFVLIAMLLVVAALWNAAETLLNRGEAVDALLSAVGLIVIAMAATDVGKYLFDEEVVRERELRSAVEARQSLTKFMVIICIAVALEGLVQIARVSQAQRRYRPGEGPAVRSLRAVSCLRSSPSSASSVCGGRFTRSIRDFCRAR